MATIEVVEWQMVFIIMASVFLARSLSVTVVFAWPWRDNACEKMLLLSVYSQDQHSPQGLVCFLVTCPRQQSLGGARISLLCFGVSICFVVCYDRSVVDTTSSSGNKTSVMEMKSTPFVHRPSFLTGAAIDNNPL